MNRSILAGAMLTAAVVAATHGDASAGQPARNVALSCVEHVNHEGNASIGHCRTAPQWTIRKCTTAHPVNCAGRLNGHDYIVREFPGSAAMVCVMYVQHAYARHNDYCEASR